MGRRPVVREATGDLGGGSEPPAGLSDTLAAVGWRITAGAIGVAWFVTIAVDFFVFGGLFAGLLDGTHPAVLSDRQLFARIPAGYTSFLIEVGLLAWVFRHRRPATQREGARLGAGIGAVFGGAILTGMWSFSTVPLAVLAVWCGTLVVQLTGAGVVLAASVTENWRATRRTGLIASALMIVGGIAIQNLL